ncbi:hypothetical protein BOTCAL_0254g00140 [Botryotinia calthae]|uniref:Uncharacterized protein n=1 Tax=Botryotinia calthae TaxID=38488 RepID=A0A4Y8CWG6_9HELO|nr:hypothetical protein BOTCAL_0254g00140 [Botryotinia calthae]
MRERSDASYYPATFQAPNLIRVSQRLLSKRQEKSRGLEISSSGNGDGIDRIDHAHKTASKTNSANAHRSSQNGGVGTTNKPARKAKKETDKKGGNSAGKRDGFRLGDALSSFKSKVTRR